MGKEGTWDSETIWHVISWQLPRDETYCLVCTAILNLLVRNEEGLICTKAPDFC